MGSALGRLGTLPGLALASGARYSAAEVRARVAMVRADLNMDADKMARSSTERHPGESAKPILGGLTPPLPLDGVMQMAFSPHRAGWVKPRNMKVCTDTFDYAVGQ